MGFSLNNLRRIGYWVLPPLLLLLVFRHIDITQLKQNLVMTNPWLMLLGIAAYPISTLIGVVRWNKLLTPYNRVAVPFIFTMKHYWIGLATGYFTPGGIGMDIYRVVVVGKRFGNYTLNMGIVFIEKFMALFTSMGLIIILYPLMVPLSSSVMIREILTVAYLVFILIIGMAVFIVFILHNAWLRQIAIGVERFVTHKLKTAAIRLGILGSQEQPLSIPFRMIVEPMTRPYRLLMIVALSLAIQISTAIGIHILFIAVGYDIDFVINLFLGPIFFLVFLMPVSFAGIGVREASFILLYGLFGVPKEIALLVSFYTMAGNLVTASIGALFIYINKNYPA